MTTNSAETMKNTSHETKTVRNVEPWTPWQDWVNVVLGAYLALSSLWTAGAPTGWFVTMGILAAAAGVWAAGTASSTPAESVQIILGAALVLSPWVAGFVAAAAAAWTAWIVGAGLIIFAAVALSMNRDTYPRTRNTTRKNAYA